MFQDDSFGPVEFLSSWRKGDKSTTEVSTQTSETLTYEAEVQTTEKTSTSVSSFKPGDIDLRKFRETSIFVQTDEEPEKPFKLVVDNTLELKEFLVRMEPIVSEQLRRNMESHAFDGYKVQWEEESTTVSCLHTLTEAALNSEFHCTGLAWNCTGSVLAVSYGRFDHQDWCSHKPLLCTWNMDRRSIDSNRADVSIEVPSCLMCMAFHPKKPAVIAGGTFSGEVCVWNTGIEGDQLLASSGFSDLGHKEPVSKVCWIPHEGDRIHRYLLLSLGSDGKVLMWDLLPDNQRELRMVRGYRLLTESVPRSLRISRAKGDIGIGGTCLSFSHEDKNLFVVGSENGGIFKCSLQAATATVVDENTAESDFQSPIKFAFRPHHGPVYCVSCSPFHRNLFLSSGTDTTTRLYSMLDATPILSVEPAAGYLFSVCWSPSRPLVFAVGSGDGHVLIYDLKSSHIKPRVSLDASPHKRAIFSIEYNPKRPQFLASGDASGVVKVWRLSTELTNQSANEVEQLNSIALEALSTTTL